MTQEQKNYILTHKAWVKSTFLNEEELEISLKHNKRMVHNLNKKIEADQEHIGLIKQFRYSGIKSYVQWLADSNISKEEADDILFPKIKNDCHVDTDVNTDVNTSVDTDIKRIPGN